MKPLFEGSLEFLSSLFLSSSRAVSAHLLSLGTLPSTTRESTGAQKSAQPIVGTT